MNKKSLIALIILIILVLGIGGVLWVNQKDQSKGKEKLYSFDNFEELQNDIHLLTSQVEIDEDILKKIDEGNYTLEEPLIIINPYKISPLTAIIGFKTEEKESLNVTIKAKNGGKDLVFDTKETKTHYIPIYGLYMEYDNKIEIKNNKETQTIIIPTEKDESTNQTYFPELKVELNKLPVNDNDFYFVSTPVGSTSAAFDQTGEIRWLLTSGIYKQITHLSNGHFLLSSLESIEEKSLGFIEVDILGRIYNSYELENPYFHNYTELPNNHILYSTEDNKVIELNLKNGNLENTYDIYSILSKIDANYMESIKDKFNYINALDCNSETGSILVGIYHYSTLISLNKKGEVEWIFADPKYYSETFNQYLLKPIGDNFIYPLGNYNAKIENDSLTLMNNGWDITKTYSCAASQGLKSSAKDYKIDLKNKTITETWSYGDKYFSFTAGDYNVQNDEKTILFGREFRQFNQPMDVCELPSEGDFESKIIVLNKNEEVFKMTISNTFNSLNKMPIYDNNYNFEKIDPKSYSANQLSDQYKEENYKDNYEKAVLYTIPLELSGNKLKALYYEKNYNIVLLNEYGNGYIYKPKDNIINIKKGLGKTLILIEKEGEIYNTGYYINL